MNSKKNGSSDPSDVAFSAEMDDLKRDVQSAQLQAWLRKHQQSLTVAIVLILLAITAGSLWTQHLSSQKDAAASLYFQGLNQSETAKKQAVLADVVKDYGDTAYAVLARLQLAALAENPVENYRAMMDDDALAKSFRWQARLDLAEYYINNGKPSDAKSLLDAHVGKQYEQLRFYLLAQVSEDDAKQQYLRQALDAASNDAVLKEKIESALGVTATAQG
ncbi:MAG: tetratricopeptide repeat protein [Mariprofundaceae bacterium]|nr:tetratricopeptide repeat protein [Mariprofundaceae bacterium]